VLVGRAAPAVLERQADALHVKLVAPRAWRIDVAAARLGVPPAQAATVLDDTDRMRARYSREYYRRDWDDPVHFHMVLNTAALGLDGATEAVVGRARVLGWG
jgi:cytidylate kinase